MNYQGGGSLLLLVFIMVKVNHDLYVKKRLCIDTEVTLYSLQNEWTIVFWTISYRKFMVSFVSSSSAIGILISQLLDDKNYYVSYIVDSYNDFIYT